MPKSSNESSRQMLEYIKKVAAAGRGGDTKLAYLSSSARQLLKDLGGAGTKNPKTKLPEYRRRRFLEEGEFMEPSAGAPPAAPAFQPPPVMPEPPAAMTPIASEPPQAPPMDPRDFRLAQEPRPMFSGMLPRNARQEFDEIAAPAQSVDSQREAELRRQAEEAQRAEEMRAAQQAEEIRRAEEMRAAQQAEEIRRSEARRQLDEIRAAENLARYSTQQQQVPAPVSVAPTPEPAVGSSAADLEELGRSLSASGMTAPPGLEEMLSTLTPGSLSSARESILPPAPQEPAPTPSETRASVRAGEDLSVTAAQRDAEVRRAADAQRRVEEGELARRRDEELRRAAEEEAARRQAEEAAARRAQEEAARRAQEEAARRAQEEAAARMAQEEAARAAQEAAARKAAQDAAAARQAEEARRMAQEAAARKAAEDAARVQPPIAPPAQPPVAPPPPPAPPPGLVESPIQKQPAPPQTGQPPGTGIFFPQPPSSPPPPPPTPPAPPGSQDPNMRTHQFIDKNLNGIDDRDEPPASVSPKPPRLRTADMQDSNNNGIDDRDEPGGADYDPNNPKRPPLRDDWPIMQPPVLGDGIRIPEVPKDKAAPAPPIKRTPQVSIPGRFLDDNTDIGRLLKRVGGGRSVSRGPSTKGGLKRGAPKPPVDEIPGADRPRPVRPEPPVGLFPEPPGGDQPTIPVQPPPNIPVRGPESQIPVRPLPGPLPTPIGAGTPTPYFNPNAGGLTPGTVPVSQMPESLKTSQVPLDAIARNPNLSPTILGGQENLGYYRDRLGNLIMAPGAVRPPGFALGGEVTDEEEDYGEQDAASARAMLDRLSSEAPEFRAIPTKRRARRQEAERGSAKGMAMELEQMSKPQGPRTKRQAEELRQKMELLRDTLGMPTLTRAGLAREGELLAQRFAEGGDVKKKKIGPLTPYEIMEQLGTGMATGVGKQIEGTAAMVQDPAGAFQVLRDQLDKVIKDPENIPGWVKDFVVEKLQRASSGPEGAGEVLADFLRLPGKGVPKRDIFIGEKSPSFDHEAKTMAEALEKRGAPKDEIIDITKTFRGADGSWKQEASDDLLSFDLEGFSRAPRLTEPRPFKERFEDALRSLSPESRKMYGPERTKYAFRQLTSPTQKPIRYEMSDFISHPVLEKAYPGITQGLLERTAPDANYLGSASARGKGVIELNTNPAVRKKMKDPKEFDPRATLVHEFQHLVQNREGSAPGGSPGLWETELPRSLFDVVFRYPRYGYMPPDFIGDVYRKAHSDRFDKNLPKEERKKAAALLKELETTYSPNNLYRALMGEAEARAAQARTYLTPEERAARSPLKDYDVDFEKQLDLREPGAYPSFYYSGRNPFAVDKSKK